LNASFLLGRLAQRVVFFYAPMILGGRDAIKAVAGAGPQKPEDTLDLEAVQWRRIGNDWLLKARVSL
jgi:diaminohydroxyphosphoribosylaminopyrimidine deaminase/5-amino-6-(5-phosphoribosylamino)uracil reductase